jgi:molybdenum-dependent DNA-binding transcriptional regulator ModE
VPLMSHIQKSNIAKLDIGMISALQVLLRERSVNSAAAFAGLSQPAMSSALARMRVIFGDPLIVRGRKGMVLTERGHTVLEEISDIVPRLDELGRQTTFEPALEMSGYDLRIGWLEMVPPHWHTRRLFDEGRQPYADGGPRPSSYGRKGIRLTPARPLQVSARLACSPRSGPLTAVVCVSKIMVGMSVGLNAGQ